MSVSALNWVLGERRQGGAPGLKGPKHAARLVLISLANFANDDGQCWPAIESICQQANVTERAAKDGLRWLEEHGYVTRLVNGAPDERVRKDRRTTLYTLALGPERGYESRSPVDGARGYESRSHGGTNRVVTGVRDSYPEAIEEASEETPLESTPSGAPSAAPPVPSASRDDPATRIVRGWWDDVKGRTGLPPTAVPYIGVVKIVRQLLTAHSEPAVKWALVDAVKTGTISVKSCELAIRQRGGRRPLRPDLDRAPVQVDYSADFAAIQAEWDRTDLPPQRRLGKVRL